MFFFNWLHTYQPSPILIDLGFLAIHWYGLLMTLAVLAGFLVARYLFKKYDISLDHLYNLSFYLIIFGFIGARFYHVINELPYYLSNPSQIIAVWNGGLALHGAVLAGVIVLFFYTSKYFKTKFKIFNSQFSIFNKSAKFPIAQLLLLADILAPALIIGQAIGRFGNYFNQELYGRACDLAWCIPISIENRVVGFESFTHFHPTFLYESLASLVIFIILIYLHRCRFSGSFYTLSCHPRESGDPAESENKPGFPIESGMIKIKPGFIFSIYLILYSIVRILTETLRIDSTPVILGLRLPIIVSTLLIIAGLFILWYSIFIWKKKI